MLEPDTRLTLDSARKILEVQLGESNKEVTEQLYIYTSDWVGSWFPESETPRF